MTDGQGLGAEKLLAAYLDQRRRLGEPDLLSETFRREEFVTALAKLRSTDPSPGSPSSASPPPRSTLPLTEASRSLGGRPDDASPKSVPRKPPLETETNDSAGRGITPQAREVTPRTRESTSRLEGEPTKANPSPVDTEKADYETLRALAMGCTSCRLAEGRTHVVFSDGNPKARLMVVGEAPGANEDATGLPFVGQAGKLLDLMLASIDLSREDSVYIANVLKCRPPGNRNPLPDEIEACSGFLKRQIELVSPQVLLTVGSFAAQLLTGTQTALGKLRGTVHSYHGVPLIVTYHPAALLRNPGWSRPTWDDLQLLRQVMDQA